MIPHGQLIAVASASQSITGVASKVTGFTGTGQHDSSTDSDKSVVPDLANNRITCRNPGTYEVTVSGTLYAAGPREIDLHVFVDGIKQTGMGALVATLWANKRVSINFTCLIDLPVLSSGVPTNQLELYALATYEDANSGASDTETLNFDHLQFTVKRLR